MDLETSGLKSWEHEILEIAVVRVDGKTLEIKEQMTCKTKPTKHVSPEAARINGYTPEKWADAISGSGVIGPLASRKGTTFHPEKVVPDKL